MPANPFLIEHGDEGKELLPIDLSKHLYDESWLQEFIRKHPGILPVGEIEPVFSPLIPIGREVALPTGAIDNLYISRQGYPVLVETKLWKNPEAKREVIAQAIDYGSLMSNWTFSNVNEVTRDYTRKYEASSLGLIEWIEQRTGPLSVDRIYFEETVAKNLRLGRFLILIVGDRIRTEVFDLVSYVNKFPHLAVNVALVELRCYHAAEGKDWPLLIVPFIVTRTDIVERSIVEVSISSDGSYRVNVTQESDKGKTEKPGRTPLSEQDYRDRLKDQAPKSYDAAYKLIDYFEKREYTSIQPKEQSIAVYLTLPSSGQQISLFFIRTDGFIVFWADTISQQLSKSNLDPGLVKSLKNDLLPVLRKRTKKLAMLYPAQDIDFDSFTAAFTRFIEEVLNSDPIH